VGIWQTSARRFFNGKMKEIKEVNTLINPEILIFDMDGTLYQLDGEGGTFKNSTLFKMVILNSVNFVISKERCGRPVAEKLIEEGLEDTIGISNFLSRRYGITRSSYFDVAWNIDPKAVIKNFEVPKLIIQKLKLNGKRKFLLTAAPRVWMENVVRELNANQIFERKYNGEMFGPKTEIFESLAKEFDPKTILSIGDQFETDLRPAIELGMSIFQVKDPNDLQKLI